MPIYRCLVRGERFPFLIDGDWQAMGFYTTRFVEAASEEDAEMAALDLLRGETAFQRGPDTPGLEHAQVYFEEVEAVAKAGANDGLTLFDEEVS